MQFALCNPIASDHQTLIATCDSQDYARPTSPHYASAFKATANCRLLLAVSGDRLGNLAKLLSYCMQVR